MHASNTPLSILVVDDDQGNLLAFKSILVELGHNVMTAASGEQALRYLLERDFALVILDVRMPGMDGFEVGQLMRERDRTQHTPILFLTAYDREDWQVQRSHELGAADYLSKPISPEDFRSKVASILASSSQD